MVACILSGLNARGLIADGSPVNVCPQQIKSCCEPDVGNHDSHDDKNCPPGEHHHHSCCSHALPLTLENHVTCWVGVTESSLLGVCLESDVPPEEPFLGSEKPPLI